MSVDIPVFEYKTRTPDANDIYSYGFAFTSSDLDGAVKSLADILPDMLRLAEVEKACQLMASEIEKTRRRVNALEHVIIPEAQANIKYITMKLDENERSTQIRLMKVKDMMLEEAHHYKEREAERGDHRDESFDFRKRPWSCHYIFKKQVGNDRPEDQGQGCRIACFSRLWNSKKNNCTEDPEPSSVSQKCNRFHKWCQHIRS